jgi:hypothetical protein
LHALNTRKFYGLIGIRGPLLPGRGVMDGQRRMRARGVALELERKRRRAKHVSKHARLPYPKAVEKVGESRRSVLEVSAHSSNRACCKWVVIDDGSTSLQPPPLPLRFLSIPLSAARLPSMCSPLSAQALVPVCLRRHHCCNFPASASTAQLALCLSWQQGCLASRHSLIPFRHRHPGQTCPDGYPGLCVTTRFPHRAWTKAALPGAESAAHRRPRELRRLRSLARTDKD